MSSVTDYMLGQTFALLTQIRAYLIMRDDSEGLTLIESEYQALKEDMEQHYYGHLKKEKSE